MSLTVQLALYGAIPAIVLLFALEVPHRACIWGYLAGALFLPMASIELQGLPNLDKNSISNFAILLSIFIFDKERLASARLRWFDGPMILFLFAYFASSVSNGIGGSLGNSLYGGYTLFQDVLFTWGIPYFVARLYLDNRRKLIELSQVFFLGGIVYVPLCLIEIRFSPQLHTWIYGYHQHSFEQTFRLGGFRPTVFMQHGLGVGMWMTLASLIGVTLWKNRQLPRLVKGFENLNLCVLLLTTVLVKSTGALFLLVTGLLTQWLSGLFGTRIFYTLMLLTPIAYCLTRTTGLWNGELLIEFVELIVGKERTESMTGRMLNEDLLIQHALQKPFLGWSGWDRSSVYEAATGRRLTTQDGMWIIALGIAGISGLTGFMGTLLLPAFGAFRQVRKSVADPRYKRLIATLGVSLCLIAVDFLMNTMPNPMYSLICGALANNVFLNSSNDKLSR